MTMKNNEVENRARWIILTEILFTNLPIIVIVFILIIKNNLQEIFYKSDFSFVSVVLFGQTLIRFISGIAKKSKEKEMVFNVFLVLNNILNWCCSIYNHTNFYLSRN